jgi:hypothetical protein
MRKNLMWVILAVLFVAIGTPNAQADSFTATFTCTGTCLSLPTAPDVTFPSPILTETWDGFLLSVPLPSSFSPTDIFTWDNSVFQCDEFVCGAPFGVFAQIIDETTQGHTLIQLDLQSLPAGVDELVQDHGALVFARVATPEPPSLALMLAGIGLLWVVRKRIALALGLKPAT